MYGNLPMNEFLIDCSFKQSSMALKFDLLIQRYAILILRYAALRGIMVSAMRHSTGFTYKFYTKNVPRCFHGHPLLT
jgi:hypothetical protein